MWIARTVTKRLSGKTERSRENDVSEPFPVLVDAERVAQMIAHRACCGSEHDPANGKLHGCCVVCGVPWPCDYVGPKPPTAREPGKVTEEMVRRFGAAFDQSVDDQYAQANREGVSRIFRREIAIRAALETLATQPAEPGVAHWKHASAEWPPCACGGEIHMACSEQSKNQWIEARARELKAQEGGR
jgi:hypothetical protein